jgi:ABC-type phosphate transport system substrate-binding protein
MNRSAVLAAAVSALLIMSIAASAVWADDSHTGFRVIVNASNPIGSTNCEFLSQVFFKRTTRWQGGPAIRPVDLSPDSSVRGKFSDAILKRSVDAVRNYWQQRIFSGRDLPPTELASDEAVVDYVARSPGAIGYVSASAKVDSVKVLVIR